MVVKIKNPYRAANEKYGWSKKVVGLPVRAGLLRIAVMAQKNIEFKVSRRKYGLTIDPEYALSVAKKYKSFFTREFDREVFAVIPDNECVKVV